MTPDPKKDHCGDEELNEQQMDTVAGGKRVPAPRAGKDLGAPELADEDLEGVSGGTSGPDRTDSLMPPRPRKGDDNLSPSEAPD